MEVIDPGHFYNLKKLDRQSSDEMEYYPLIFVKREGEGYPGNVGHYGGTNMQEVLRALIDRVKYLDNQIHDDRNIEVLHHLRWALFQLEVRAAERHGRGLPGFSINAIEFQPVCEKCGHIGCSNECH